MGRKTRVKPCDRCSQPAPILYRVKHEENGEWVFVCPQCWVQVSPHNPFYVYGGTGTQKKNQI